MESLYPVRKEPLALPNRVANADLVDGLGIVLNGLKPQEKLVGYLGTTARHEALDLRHILNGDQPSQNRNRNPCRTAQVAPAQEVFIIKKQLRDNKACPSIELTL